MVKAGIECPICGSQGKLDTSMIPCTMECVKCGNDWRITWNRERPGQILMTNLSTGEQYKGWIPAGQL